MTLKTPVDANKTVHAINLHVQFRTRRSSGMDFVVRRLRGRLARILSQTLAHGHSRGWLVSLNEVWTILNSLLGSVQPATTSPCSPSWDQNLKSLMSSWRKPRQNGEEKRGLHLSTRVFPSEWRQFLVGNHNMIIFFLEIIRLYFFQGIANEQSEEKREEESGNLKWIGNYFKWWQWGWIATSETL